VAKVAVCFVLLLVFCNVCVIKAVSEVKLKLRSGPRSTLATWE
jgi:hypothetical protein